MHCTWLVHRDKKSFLCIPLSSFSINSVTQTMAWWNTHRNMAKPATNMPMCHGHMPIHTCTVFCEWNIQTKWCQSNIELVVSRTNMCDCHTDKHTHTPYPHAHHTHLYRSLLKRTQKLTWTSPLNHRLEQCEVGVNETSRMKSETTQWSKHSCPLSQHCKVCHKHVQALQQRVLPTAMGLHEKFKLTCTSVVNNKPQTTCQHWQNFDNETTHSTAQTNTLQHGQTCMPTHVPTANLPAHHTIVSILP